MLRLYLDEQLGNEVFGLGRDVVPLRLVELEPALLDVVEQVGLEYNKMS